MRELKALEIAARPRIGRLSQCELGIEAEFWQNDPAKEEARPDVPPMVRPG